MLLCLVARLRRRPAHLLRGSAALGIGFAVIFGWWPLRNYVAHGRVVFTEDLRAFPNWSVDVLGFLQYIYAVKAEWEPQFTHILRNEPVEFSRMAYAAPGDDQKLRRAVRLSQTCGSGFSHWKGYWKAPISDGNCDEEIARLFGELRDSQRHHNKLNFYVWVPLQNLGKALFKQRLVDEHSRARRLASYLFLYRTVLLCTGLVGAMVIIRSGDPTGLLSAGYFAAVYLTICAGILPQMRNIEIRYLLPADVLLLIPS
jgi:hypothetical protein